jgi:hypothetical protein
MARGTYKWSSVKSLIQDRIRSEAFMSDNLAQILRAFNSALDRMNAGDTGVANPLGVAFNFQKEEKDISYSTTTGHDYAFSALSITEETFKFPADHGLRIDSDENEYFTHRSPEYWYRRHGVEGSSEKMFCLEYNGNTLTLKINHDTTETLNFWFYTNAMVLDDGGTTRRAYVDGESDDDTFLFPDRFINVALDFTMYEIYGQKAEYTDARAQFFLSEARRGLRGMISSIGKYEIKPVEMAKIRSEWRSGLNRISRT